MRIPPDKIEEVRAASDILQVVQQYVTLKPRGANHFGLCPFHAEKTGSFAVNPGKQIFRCFGCGRGGNVFGFLMEIEKLSFYEAVKLLAERAGIELPRERMEREDKSESELLVKANTLARDFFFQQLTAGTSAGAREAREYLNARGYDKKVIERYLLGYAPDSWDALTEFAKARGIPLAVMIQAGLLKEGRETNRPYDAFRHRVMFAIHNLSGRVIAFGGRRLRDDDDEGGAKYINSAETAIYRKGRELFGLWEARNDVRSRNLAILVEGYTDCLSLVTAGVPVAVASLGTALTEQQARLLRRYTENVRIFYDSDHAGLAAARRAVDILLGVGAMPRIMVAPEGEDPDSFVRKAGGEAVWKLAHDALSIVDFQLLLAARFGHTKAQAARELVGTAALITSAIDQDVLLQEIASKTGIRADAIRRELNARTATRGAAPAEQPREKWPKPGTITLLTEVLVRRPMVRAEVFAQWSPDDVEDPHLKTLLDYLYQEWQSGEMREPYTLLDQFPEPPLRDFLTNCIFSTDDLVKPDEPPKDGKQKISRAEDVDRRVALDCLSTLRADQVKLEIARIKAQLQAAPEEAAGLLPKMQQLMRQERELRRRGTTSGREEK